MTIRTVTMSPGFDHVVRVDEATSGGVARVLAWETLASGKGVNVAREATKLGASCVAYSLIGEVDQDTFVDLIHKTGAGAVVLPVPGSTRMNLTLEIEGSGSIASHAVGPRLVAEDSDADGLIALLVDQVEPGDVVTFNGALPDAVRPEVWADAAHALTDRDVTVIADVQNDALVAVVDTGRVTMAKPNEDEARALPGVGELASVDAAAAAALAWMHDRGVADPVVSLGERGIVYLDDGATVRSWCPVTKQRVVVGAGDAFIAGYCSALDSHSWSGQDPLTLGLAAAAVHVAGTCGTHLDAVREAVTRVRHEPWAV